jgi:hypothetical protein
MACTKVFAQAAKWPIRDACHRGNNQIIAQLVLTNPHVLHPIDKGSILSG